MEMLARTVETGRSSAVRALEAHDHPRQVGLVQCCPLGQFLIRHGEPILARR